MDPKRAELALAKWVQRPDVHRKLCELWTRVTGDDYQPTPAESLWLDIWLLTDDAGHLHDDYDSRERADFELKARTE
jgi:hypothetical protein